MPTWSVGKTISVRLVQRSRDSVRQQAGVTLVEMMIVVTLVALVAGLTYPSLSSGLETLRLRAASDSVVSLLNTSLERAERRQQAVEIQIWPKEGVLQARSADLGFTRRLEIPQPLRITDIVPHLPNNSDDAMRRVIVYPGGAAPGLGIEISTPAGRKRMVSVDPITGVPQAQ